MAASADPEQTCTCNGRLSLLHWFAFSGRLAMERISQAPLVCQIGRQALGRSRADNVVFRTDNPESAANSYFVCFRCNANWHAFFPTGRLQADAWRLSRRSQPEAAQLRRCLLRPQVRFMFGRTGRISAARLVGVACTEWIYRRPPLRFIRRATKVPLAASALPRTTPRSSGLRPCGH